MPKCAKIRLAAGIRPNPLRSLCAPPDSLAAMGAYSWKGHGREERGDGKEGGHSSKVVLVKSQCE